MDDPRKERRSETVGEHEPERTDDEEIFVDLLILVGSRFARAGEHEYRRPFDALFIHFELCDMLRLGAINAARFARERGKIALLAVEELFNAEFFFQDGRNVAFVAPFELGEETARVVADAVFLVGRVPIFFRGNFGDVLRRHDFGKGDAVLRHEEGDAEPVQGRSVKGSIVFPFIFSSHAVVPLQKAAHHLFAAALRKHPLLRAGDVVAVLVPGIFQVQRVDEGEHRLGRKRKVGVDESVRLVLDVSGERAVSGIVVICKIGGIAVAVIVPGEHVERLLDKGRGRIQPDAVAQRDVSCFAEFAVERAPENRDALPERFFRHAEGGEELFLRLSRARSRREGEPHVDGDGRNDGVFPAPACRLFKRGGGKPRRELFRSLLHGEKVFVLPLRKGKAFGLRRRGML